MEDAPECDVEDEEGTDYAGENRVIQADENLNAW